VHSPTRGGHEAFRDAVQGKAAEIVTMRQGLATVAVAEAVMESARLRRSIDLENSQ
jgi:UDP-N-acetylglucosamine 3-dehydrogenase